MEIGFEKKLEPRYRESVRLAKRIQESAESVVPDTEEDIGRIAAVQSSVLLKSKDMSGRGVLITGEARACVLCIGEGGERISCVRLAKPFSAEFEVAELSGEEQTQISLTVAATDARLLNPRKLSVTFDLAAELSCYVPESIAVETSPPGENCRGLHVRCAETELQLHYVPHRPAHDDGVFGDFDRVISHVYHLYLGPARKLLCARYDDRIVLVGPQLHSLPCSW